MSLLDHLDDPRQARAVLLRLATGASQAVALAMLGEALDQIELLAPPLSGEAWDAYLAIERAAERGLRVVR